MKFPTSTPFLTRGAIIFAFGLSGWFAWYSAWWLVGHDDIYFRLRGAGFGFITEAAEMIDFAGLIPALFLGVGSGFVAAAFHTRRRVSREESQ